MSDLKAVREPLRLKGLPLKKKKKKKEKEMKHLVASDLKVDVNKNSDNGDLEAGESSEKEMEEIPLTKAELAFLKKHEKLQEEKIRQQAAKSHRQLVEEFNNKLDNMSEHYDIPKVSWTK